MLKTYCTECGSPTTYSSSKPKFCSGCGVAFDKIVVNKTLMQKRTMDAPKKSIKIVSKKQPIVDEEDHSEDDNYDQDEVNYVPEVNGLDIEMQQVERSTTKIKDILGSAKSPFKREKIQSKKITKADRKKFLEDFSREAGSLRPKNRGQKDG
jgi:hypothetical protein